MSEKSKIAARKKEQVSLRKITWRYLEAFFVEAKFDVADGSKLGVGGGGRGGGAVPQEGVLVAHDDLRGRKLFAAHLIHRHLHVARILGAQLLHIT